MDGHKIHINKQTRTLRFRGKDVLLAQGAMPAGRSLLHALLFDRDEAAVCVGAAFALRHEFEGANADKAPSPGVVSEWLDREPGKYRELERAVLRAAEDHYVARERIRRGDLTGEVPAATTMTPSPNTSPSTELPVDGDSTPSLSLD